MNEPEETRTQRGPHDRIQWDGDLLDEVVVSNVTFHIERMSHHGWWMCVDDKRGNRMDFWWAASSEVRTEGGDFPGIKVVNREPLAFWCERRWFDSHGAEHQCDVEHDHSRHLCECGATKKEPR